MIYVTCGHEKGVGLEVFLKSYILLSRKEQKLFTLICEKKSLIETCESLQLNYVFTKDYITIAHYNLNIILVDDVPISTEALKKSLDIIKNTDTLITLPTSKDQLLLNGEVVAGHTEYFRKYFKKNVSMFFKSHSANVLLISDHVSLKEVSSYITPELIEDQIHMTIKDYLKYFGKLSNIYICFCCHAFFARLLLSRG